jgi:hypothetical protein
MNQLVHIIKRCQILLKRHRALSWGFPVAIVTLVLLVGIGFTPSLHAVQAQNSGSFEVNFKLDVRASNQTITMCLNERESVPVSAIAHISLPGTATNASVRVRNAVVTARPADSSIVRTEVGMSSSASSPDAPFPAVVALTGLAVGSTTVSLNATIESTTLLAFDEDAALPFDRVNGTQNITLSVRVVPCQYRVDIGSTWVTTLNGANTLIRIKTLNFRLRSSGGVTLNYDPRINDVVTWSATVNRIRGCLASNHSFEAPVPALSMRGEIQGDRLSLTISVSPLSGGGVLFPCIQRVEDQNRIKNCGDYMDGECQPMPPNPTFTPDSVTVHFDLDGGTQRVSQGLAITRGGNPQGTMSITLTPVEAQP